MPANSAPATHADDIARRSAAAMKSNNADGVSCSHRLRNWFWAAEKFASKCFRGDPRTGAFVIGTTSILFSLCALLEAARLDQADVSSAVLSGYAGLNVAFLVSALLASLTDQANPAVIRPWFVFQLALMTGILSFGLVILHVIIPSLEPPPPLATAIRPGFAPIRQTTPAPAGTTEQLLKARRMARELRIAGWGLIGACGIQAWFLLFVWYNYTKLTNEQHMLAKSMSKVEERNHAWLESASNDNKPPNKQLFRRANNTTVGAVGSQ